MKVEPNGFHDQSSTKHPIQQLTHLKAALISIKKATQFTNSVQILLLERIHPGAVQPLRMGWLTGKSLWEWDLGNWPDRIWVQVNPE